MKVQVFPNGLTLEEGYERARLWWETVGRELVRKLAADDTPEDKGGMMNGVPFDMLTVEEAHKVVSVWYENKGKYL